MTFKDVSFRIAIALVLFSLAFSLACDGDAGSGETDGSQASRVADEEEVAIGRGVSIVLAEGGRGQFALGENANLRRFWLELEVRDRMGSADEAGARAVRVVGIDGRRFDTTAEAHPSKPNWVRVEVEAGFLTPGLYMIEVDAVDDHALDFRRFVLDVTP